MENKKLDYIKLKEIIVKSQEELNAIPADFKGQIYVEFGTLQQKAIIKTRYNNYVVALGNSSVVARENSSVEAWGNSSVVARENSSVVARENSSVEARGNSSVVARENSSVVARGNSSVVARENSSVEARENSSVVARGNSSVVARENSSVEARENSSVVARNNVQVVGYSKLSKIKISGNARKVDPYYQNINAMEFVNFHNIKCLDGKAVFYKAVRKKDEIYYSDYQNSFTYKIGETATAACNKLTSEQCGTGIHISHLYWALDYGASWNNLAILEVEVDINDIVVPAESDGKCRASTVRVLREVPLEECGVYGKMLVKKRRAE